MKCRRKGGRFAILLVATHAAGKYKKEMEDAGIHSAADLHLEE